MQVHTVFSVDGSLYHRWQADLLAYSHWKAGQTGPLTQLWCAWGEPPIFDGQTFQTMPYSPHPVSGDSYLPYNKPMALLTWLEDAPPAEEAVLLLDPDCIFIAPCDLSAIRGEPVSQPIGYMDPASNAELVKRHGCKPTSVQGIGIPTLIHRDDLVALTPLWVEITEAIRTDPVSRQLAGWTAEMWAYIFAAARLGLRHQLRDLARWQREDQVDLPFIHYCYASSSADGRWEWNKRTYKPWQQVPDPPPGTPLATVTLIDMLNEWAKRQEHRILP